MVFGKTQLKVTLQLIERETDSSSGCLNYKVNNEREYKESSESETESTK